MKRAIIYWVAVLSIKIILTYINTIILVVGTTLIYYIKLKSISKFGQY